jgi:Tol biopolymer transport system component
MFTVIKSIDKRRFFLFLQDMQFGERKINWSVWPVLLCMSILSVSCGSSSGGGGPGGLGGGNQPVVFIANKDMVLDFHLYASFDNGFEVIKLSEQPFVVNGDVQDFKISPDGETVAFRADHEFAGQIELYVVPITGGMLPVKVSRDLDSNGDVTDDYEWSPDSLRIAYRADQLGDDQFELFTTKPDGSEEVKVSRSLVANGAVTEFSWSPDGTLIAYIADALTDDQFDLFTTTGLLPFISFNLSNFFDPTQDVTEFEWSPDSTLIAYIADGLSNQRFELFVTASAGIGVSTVVSDIVLADTDVIAAGWAPDGSRIAYIADQDTAGVFELYSVTPDGLNPDLVSESPMTGDVIDFRWAPDSDRIAYIADQETLGVVEIFAANPNGAFNSKLSSNVPLAQDQVVIDVISGKGIFEWAPDSSRVAYLADQATLGQVELFSSTPAGATNDVVSGLLVSGGNVEAPIPPFSGEAFLWSPDSSRIAYRADQDKNNVFELFSSRADGSDNKKISDDLSAGKAVQEFAWGSEAF